MKFGICTLSNAEAAVESVLETAAATGYGGVEVWGRDHVGNGSPENCRAIRERTADLGLDIPVYGSYLRAGTPSFDDDLERELEIADRLGADLIRVWAGNQAFANHDQNHWESVTADLTETTERAAEHGLAVTVEKHADTLTDELTGARHLIEAIDDENCGLNWQPDFDTPAGKLAVESKVLAPLSNNVHVQAVAERGTRDRCPLAEAYFDLERLLKPFETGSFDGYVNVEFVDPNTPYDEAVANDLAYLRSITG